MDNFFFEISFFSIVNGQKVSIIYKTHNLWGDGGIGRRVGLRNQYGNM